MSKANSTRIRTVRLCEFPGCDMENHAKGLCISHYSQYRRGIELMPRHLRKRENGSPPRIVYDEVPCLMVRLKGPCHVFRGCKVEGYGQVSVGKRMVRVHRYVWEQAKGKIVGGKVIDHKCRNRACCNILHLRLVTRRVNGSENVVGAYWQTLKARTHCFKGHPFDAANTLVRTKTKKGSRVCRACCREATRQRRMRAKQ